MERLAAAGRSQRQQVNACALCEIVGISEQRLNANS
jgi:hypothetical protein